MSIGGGEKIIDLADFKLKKAVDMELAKDEGEPQTLVPSRNEISEVLGMLGLVDKNNLRPKKSDSEFCRRRKEQLKAERDSHK